jgi:hypothetical protein
MRGFAAAAPVARCAGALDEANTSNALVTIRET